MSFSLQSFVLAALISVGAAAPKLHARYTSPSLSGPLHVTCDASAPPSCTNGTVDSCCTEATNGVFMQTQFWDYNPATGPHDVWTIHGLWSDKCGGGYNQSCNPSWEITDPLSILQNANQTDLLDIMNTNWKNDDGNDPELWEHEFNKHGTCMATVDPSCYDADAPKYQYVVDFYTSVVTLWQTLPTYKFLTEAGIYPSETQTYTVAQFQSALGANFNGNSVYLGCDENNTISEMYYYFSLQGAVASGVFTPMNSPDGTGTCVDGFYWLPKSNNTVPNTVVSTVEQGQLYLSSPAGECLSPAGTIQSDSCTDSSFTATSNIGGFAVTSNDGPCNVVNNALTCGSGVTAGDFTFTDGYLAYGGETSFNSPDNKDVLFGTGSTDETFSLSFSVTTSYSSTSTIGSSSASSAASTATSAVRSSNSTSSAATASTGSAVRSSNSTSSAATASTGSAVRSSSAASSGAASSGAATSGAVSSSNSTSSRVASSGAASSGAATSGAATSSSASLSPLERDLLLVESLASVLASLIEDWSAEAAPAKRALFGRAVGTAGALQIQSSYSPLSSALVQLDSDASALDQATVHENLDNIINTYGAITDVLNNLAAKAADFQAISASDLVKGDLNGIAGPSADFVAKVSSADSDCADQASIAPAINSAKSAYASAASIYGANSASFPVLPAASCGAASSGASKSAEPTGSVTTITTVVSEYTTYCPDSTTFTEGTKTYTVTGATTLTITDCPCTRTTTVPCSSETEAPKTESPETESAKTETAQTETESKATTKQTTAAPATTVAPKESTATEVATTKAATSAAPTTEPIRNGGSTQVFSVILGLAVAAAPFLL